MLIGANAAAGSIPKLPHADWAVSEILGGAFVTIVTCATFGDLSGVSRSFLIDRGIERSWAVILIGLVVDLIATVGLFGLQSPNLLDIVLASAILLMTATLMFASVDAVVGEDPWWRVLPFAFFRSISAGWRATVFPRALIALAVGYMGEQTLVLALAQAMTALHASNALLWAEGIGEAVLLPPVQAFVTIVYLDAIGYRRPRT